MKEDRFIKKDKDNKNRYIIYVVVLFVIGISIILIVKRNTIVPAPTKSTKERATTERLFVRVSSNTMRELSSNIGTCNYTATEDSIFCNLAVSPGIAIDEYFTPEFSFWQEQEGYTENNLKLKAEIMPNNDTVVYCPVIFLYRLIKKAEN